jgi:hypothetical protein
LTSQREVADALGLSVSTMERYLARYPWHLSGLADGKVNGRWRVPRADVLAWRQYVRKEETPRHPEARRFRPEEPPEFRNIRAREAKAPVRVRSLEAGAGVLKNEDGANQGPLGSGSENRAVAACLGIPGTQHSGRR